MDIEQVNIRMEMMLTFRIAALDTGPGIFMAFFIPRKRVRLRIVMANKETWDPMVLIIPR